MQDRPHGPSVRISLWPMAAMKPLPGHATTHVRELAPVSTSEGKQ